MFCFLFLAPYARTTRYEEAFFPWKTKEKKARFARAPHDYNNRHLPVVIVLRGSGINVLHEKRKKKKTSSCVFMYPWVRVRVRSHHPAHLVSAPIHPRDTGSVVTNLRYRQLRCTR